MSSAGSCDTQYISLRLYLQILTVSAFHPHSACLRPAQSTPIADVEEGCGLYHRLQLFQKHVVSMFVGTALFWSNFLHNLCVLLQLKL